MCICQYKEYAMKYEKLSQEVTYLHADICSALADPNRILILYALNDQPQNVTDLANILNISQPTASRHLKILRERGLVRPERQGISITYHLTDERLIQALDILREVLRDGIQYRATLLDVP